MLHPSSLPVLSTETVPGLISCPHHYDLSASADSRQRQNAAGERQADRGTNQDAEAEAETGGGAEDAAGAREERRTGFGASGSLKSETRTS